MQTFNTYGPAYAPNLQRRTDLLLKEAVQDPCEILQFQEVWKQSHFHRVADRLTPHGYIARFPQKELKRGDTVIKVGLASFIAAQNLPELEELYFYQVNNHDGILDGIRDAFGVGKGIHRQTLEISGSGKFTLINTHTHPLSQPIRVAQMAELILFVWERIADTPEPLVLTGDFNAVPDSLELRLVKNVLRFEDSFNEANRSYQSTDCTLCTDNPHGFHHDNRVVDYILHRAGTYEKLIPLRSTINWRGKDGETLSDHYGVRTNFERDDNMGTVSEEVRLERLVLAAETVKEAQALLASETKEHFQQAKSRLVEIAQALEAAKKNPSALSYFRNL